MWKLVAVVLALAATVCAAETRPGGTQLAETQKGATVEVRADWRVELMSIVFRLAGNPEYNMPSSRSPYSAAVEEHFGKFKGHAAVKMAADLRRTRGVSFDAVMSLAVHLDDATRPPKAPRLRMAPARLDDRWTAKDAERFVGLLGEFVKDTDFGGFLEKQDKTLAACAERLSVVVNKTPLVPFFDGYFGQRASAKYMVFVGMLCGGANYGVSAKLADGHEEITPVIGIYAWDLLGRSQVGDEVRPTLIHEFCHAYTNEIVNRHWKELQEAGDSLFEKNAGAMQQMAYGDGKTLMYESLVRACVARATASLEGGGGEKAGEAQAVTEVVSGFVWTMDLAELLKEYEGDRKKYPTFDDFMPRIAAFFGQTAAHYDDLLAKFPRVKEIRPVNGATDVDAGAAMELVVTFDRAMRDGSWAVVTSAESPQFGRPKYDEGRTVLRVPMTLAGGKKYRFWLNVGRFHSFVAEDGRPLLSVEVKLSTK